jgi:GNAT superfamily N-acetyltransferase
MSTVVQVCETPQHAARVVEMCLRFIQETPYASVCGSGANPLSIGRVVEFCVMNGVVLLAVDRQTDQVVGFIGLVAMQHPIVDERYADELAWWVEPEHRKGRAGYQLLRAAEEWARQAGCSMVKMVAPAHSDTVGAFLARRGYAVVETTYHKRL